MRFVVLLTLCACGARTDLGGSKSSASDASAPDAPCQDEIVAQEAQGASALAVDGDDVFWFWLGGLVHERHAGVVTTFPWPTAAPASQVSSLVLDTSYMYYTTLQTVFRVPRSGGESSTVATNAGEAFALAENGSDLFWIDYGSGIAAGSILRNDQKIVTMIDTPGGLAVTDAHVFATSALAVIDQSSVMGPLLRANHDGSGLGAIAQNLQQPKGVVAFGGRVYFIEQTDDQSSLHGGVRSIDENGGPTQVEVETDGYLPIDFAVDASGVYATAYSQSESVLFHGNTIIAKTPGVFYEAVRTNATAVYWTITWGGAPPADGASVRKICK